MSKLPTTGEFRQDWLYTNWRPLMAWQYMIVCLFDFMIAPIIFPIIAYYLGTGAMAWHPLTLEGGGLYHLSMGAIVGVTSWNRGNLKLLMARSTLGSESGYTEQTSTATTTKVTAGPVAPPVKDPDIVPDKEIPMDDASLSPPIEKEKTK